MNAEQKFLGLVTARGGSKSVPRKNLSDVGGKPLIAWTIEAALQSQSLDRVVVSTEDEEIAEVSRHWGADVPFMRPPELAQDETAHISVVLHALQWLESHEDERPDYVVLLQPTSPLRVAEDIDDAMRLALDKNAHSVIGVCETHSHPYLTKRITEDGTLEDFIPGGPKQGSSAIRRQALPAAYVVNGAIFLNRHDVLKTTNNFVPPGSMPYIMPQERSLEIDSPWDLQAARLILEQHSLDAIAARPMEPGKTD